MNSIMNVIMKNHLTLNTIQVSFYPSLLSLNIFEKSSSLVYETCKPQYGNHPIRKRHTGAKWYTFLFYYLLLGNSHIKNIITSIPSRSKMILLLLGFPLLSLNRMKKKKIRKINHHMETMPLSQNIEQMETTLFSTCSNPSFFKQKGEDN